MVSSCVGCSFAIDKTAVVASSKAIGVEVSDALSHLGGTFTSSAVSLGVDYTACRALRVQGRFAKPKLRIS